MLDKIEEQRKANGGKVFGRPRDGVRQTLRLDRLIEAIRYGEQPEIRARIHKIIGAKVIEGFKELLEERTRTGNALAQSWPVILAASRDGT